MKVLTTHLGLLFAATVAFSAAGARAEELRPAQAHSIVLSDVTGVVYYTSERDGFRVVATLGGTSDATPVRFIATLTPDQTAIISVPRGVGEPDAEVALVRHGDRLLVSDRRIAMR